MPDWLQKAFAWHKSPGAYVVAGLTLDELERLEAAERPDPAKTLLAASAVGAGLAFGAGVAAFIRRPAERTEPPLRPWHPSA